MRKERSKTVARIIRLMKTIAQDSRIMCRHNFTILDFSQLKPYEIYENEPVFYSSL